MEDKDIEKKLKFHADKITVKDFSERWNAIQLREDFNNSKEEVLIQEPLLVNDTGHVTVNHNNKKLSVIIISAFLAYVIICLSIVLPIVLQRSDEIRYYDVNDLYADVVSDYDFYDKLTDANIEVIAFEEAEVETYFLYYTSDNILVGGGVELINESVGYISHVNFYNNAVAVRNNLTDYEKYYVEDITIKYYTNFDNEWYSTTAMAQYQNLTYVIDCLSIGDDVLILFESLFS